MSRGASNFLSETPEIYEIATEKPRVTQRSLLPGTRPAAAGEIGISPNVLVIDFPLMRAHLLASFYTFVTRHTHYVRLWSYFRNHNR